MRREGKEKGQEEEQWRGEARRRPPGPSLLAHFQGHLEDKIATLNAAEELPGSYILSAGFFIPPPDILLQPVRSWA